MVSARILLLLFCEVLSCILSETSAAKWNPKWENFVVVGDSTAGQLSEVLAELLHCSDIAGEDSPTGRIPDATYFSRNGNITDLRIHTRDCHGCVGRRFSCITSDSDSEDNWNHGITKFEYFPMEYVMDNEMTTLRNYWEKTCVERDEEPSLCYQSITTQEYLFGEYFSSSANTCPDVIYHMGTHVHDMSRRTTEQYRSSVTWMFSTIKIFLDNICPDTTYYWSPSSRILEIVVPHKFKKISTNNKVLEFNDIATKTLLSFGHSRMLLGFDQFNFTLHMDVKLYRDDMHLKKIGYMQMSKGILLHLGLIHD